jgi:hypothetical protein
MTTPLPPMAKDPAITGGAQVRRAFTAQAAKIRGDSNLSDIAKAQGISDLWDASNAELARLYQDLQSRRRARLAVLEKLVPVGPNIPADASPADATVLRQAFRAALTEARDASPDRKIELLADAEKFDDDNLRRAVITAAFEQSQTQVLQRWTDSMGLTDRLDEMFELQKALIGRGFSNLYVTQALSKIPQPDEASALPSLIAARDAAARASVQYGGRFSPNRRVDIRSITS